MRSPFVSLWRYSEQLKVAYLSRLGKTFVSLAIAGKIQVLDIMPEHSLYVLLGFKRLLYIFRSSVYIYYVYIIVLDL